MMIVIAVAILSAKAAQIDSLETFLGFMEERLSYDDRTNTVYMNYSGLRVRNTADLSAIGDAVDRFLTPLGRRVNAVVNYERFTCDDDVFDEYIELVKRVEQTYYLSVKRFALCVISNRLTPWSNGFSPTMRNGEQNTRSGVLPIMRQILSSK